MKNNIKTTEKGYRLSLAGDLIAQKYIKEYKGLPYKVDHPNMLLNAFTKASPALKLTLSAIRLYEYLFAMTSKQDWEYGHLAIVWPSNERILDDLGWSSQKHLWSLFNQLRKIGLLGYKDSPSKKRYGKRNKDGYINYSCTFGIILNSIAGLYKEFKDIALQYNEFRKHKKMIIRNISAYRTQRKELTFASINLEKDILEDINQKFDALDIEYEATKKDFVLKEDIMKRYRLILDDFIDNLRRCMLANNK